MQFKVTAGTETSGEEFVIEAESPEQARAQYQLAWGSTALPVVSVEPVE